MSAGGDIVRAIERAGFEEVPRARGRDLTPQELEGFVAELATRPELWIEEVRHDAGERHYAELFCDEYLTAWLICWMSDHDTGFHDHDLSAGAVAVVGGSVREERLTLTRTDRGRHYTVGETFHFSAMHIHRVRHAGTAPAVTLHAYSPPLLSMGAYVIGDDGVLVRRGVSAAEELRA